MYDFNVHQCALSASNRIRYKLNIFYLTHILEKIVPMAKYIILGSFSRILFGECIIQTVEIMKNKTKGTKGLMASGNVRILPVLSLYDLQIIPK